MKRAAYFPIVLVILITMMTGCTEKDNMNIEKSRLLETDQPE